jgi:surface protein
MFYNCRNLRSIPLFNTATVTNMQNIFDECNSLRSIPQLNTAAITSSVTFYRCYSLTVGRTNGMRFAVNYSGCKLTATEINAIFTGLGTASGSQIVNVSSNMGSATCDQTIATAKGWTVTV